MKKYTKVHKSEKAFEGHLKNLRKRGAAILTKVKGDTKKIEYSFKSKKA